MGKNPSPIIRKGQGNPFIDKGEDEECSQGSPSGDDKDQDKGKVVYKKATDHGKDGGNHQGDHNIGADEDGEAFPRAVLCNQDVGTQYIA